MFAAQGIARQQQSAGFSGRALVARNALRRKHPLIGLRYMYEKARGRVITRLGAR